ncbi:MAG TPA: type II toxin-antitoxin system RelE/ParE family toxin [Candidatus Blautia merdigallinarum]|uniref:Type II toxin-antitoxin system RelE/ParE family toxin n=1 Tax=Candidatus Blautia merdigallinarum TaxID=2838495 RepID=A0A9D2SJZ5_9FIRM|nr:type II toxin-antitoxin system RelE/ParE family toxin [Candidatus Blautia merdigallinarum]
MRNKKYQVVIAESAKRDVAEKKNYILEHFEYRQYAEDFSQKMKKAISQLDTFPTGYAVTDFQYRGYKIYLKPQSGCLIFYTVVEETDTVTVLRILQSRMNWRYIIWNWIKKNKR